jgi:hypothetical protein
MKKKQAKIDLLKHPEVKKTIASLQKRLDAAQLVAAKAHAASEKAKTF